MRNEPRFVPLRSVRFFVCVLTSLIVFISIGCDSPTEGEYGLRGEWEGYIGFTMSIPPLIKGDFSLCIENGRVCSCNGTLTGSYEGWGDFTIEFTGCPTITPDREITGTMSLLRYRTGADTLAAYARIWGNFSELTPAAFGEWSTVEGSAFAAAGRWGAEKK